MITAGVLAKNADVPLYTVRHYTRIGLLRPSRHPMNGYKIYQPADETRLRFNEIFSRQSREVSNRNFIFPYFRSKLRGIKPIRND